MYSYNKADKLRKPPLMPSRILDQLRERLRYMHYSLQTEKSYVYWARWYIRWHGVQHPKDMGGKEVEAFLSMLANERRVSASTHRQALSALLFLYKEVLDIELPWMQEIGRPALAKRIPAVLTVEEVGQVLMLMNGVTGLLARLIYGTGMRLREALSLRIKDIDFSRRLIIVRQGKGGKDRVVMLPVSLLADVERTSQLCPRHLGSGPASASSGRIYAVRIRQEISQSWGDVGMTVGLPFPDAFHGSSIRHSPQTLSVS